MDQTFLTTVSRKAMLMLLLAGAPALAITASTESNEAAMVQQQASDKIQGTVVDTKGEPIIGASIRVKGGKGTAITDLDGRFTVNAARGANLEISYIGYKTKTVKATSSRLQILLEEDAKVLNDVVVVGYGTMRKKDLTGSVIQIKPDKLENQNPGSVQDILRGNAGLNVGLSTSAKGGGSMEIRGQRSISSISTHDPLLIVDGLTILARLMY